MRKNKKILLSLLLAIIGGAALVIVVVFLAVSILNADLYGRSTELRTVYGWPGFSKQPQSPEIKVRLVIHRLLPDENAAELSLISEMNPSELAKLSLQLDKTLTISAHDGSALQPFDLGGSIVIPVDPQKYKSSTIESERFRLPTLSSVAGFPFDDIQFYVPVYVKGSNGLDYGFQLEIQKAFPGRILETDLKSGSTPLVVLRRSPLEKGLVIASSLIFLIVCGLVVAKLFASSKGFTGLEQVLAFAGFLIACGEFRSFLDVPKTSGTSALEILVFVLPMSMLAIGFAWTTLRGSTEPA